MNEKYEYVIAYSLSGVTRPTDSEDVVILTSSDASVTLSGNPDEALGHADRDSAVRTGILKGLFTPSEVKNLDDEVAVLRADRKHLLGNAGCLVIRFCGPVTLDRSSQVLERGSYRFGFDLLDKDAIRGVRRREVSAILPGLLSVLPEVSDALKVAESVYILDDTGLATYTSNPKVSALASVVRVLSAEDMATATSTVEAALQSAGFERVQRLVGDACDPKLDRLRQFLSAWTGLEVLVNQLFKRSEDEFFSGLSAVAPPAAISVLSRTRGVMRDKYRLVDRFALVSSHMSPSTADADAASFMNAKTLRDRLLHGHDVSEGGLPLEETRRLLVSYFRLALERPAKLTTGWIGPASPAAQPERWTDSAPHDVTVILRTDRGNGKRAPRSRAPIDEPGGFTPGAGAPPPRSVFDVPVELAKHQTGCRHERMEQRPRADQLRDLINATNRVSFASLSSEALTKR